MLDYKGNNNYQTDATYPDKIYYTTYYFYNKGELIFKYGYDCQEVTIDDLHKFAAAVDVSNDKGERSILTTLKSYYANDFTVSDDYLTARKDYAVKEQEMYNKWRNDLFQEYEIVNPEIGDIILSQAWSDNHSEGLSSVEQRFSDLQDFADKIIKAYVGA